MLRSLRICLNAHVCLKTLEAPFGVIIGSRPRSPCALRTMAAAMVPVDKTSITYLNQADAIAVDEELMGPLGFSVDQLMELAGLSVACSLASEYQVQNYARVLVIAGPGNNGGDGLVAARHLHHFGYQVKIAYPKPTKKPLFDGLVSQCESLGLEFLSVDELRSEPLKDRFDVILEGIFGFSFKGTPRTPFDVVLELLKPEAQPPPIVSIDIPSGWQVETGDDQGGGIRPEMLVSLTAPKLCAQFFKGPYHYLGGRFVPPYIKNKYKLLLPEYPGMAQCVRVNSTGKSLSDMRISYENGFLDEDQMAADPIEQFKQWMKEADEESRIVEANAMTVASVGADGRPSSRIVLLKGVDERGFIFYTNYDGRKGEELRKNGHAALSFFWEPLQRQVRIEGPAMTLEAEESDAYFNSRPLGSRIGALASNQSSVLPNRKVLEDRVKELTDKYGDGTVPITRPENWGGILVAPLSIEFWQGRPSRLHDRIRYRRDSLKDMSWRMERLSP